MTQNELLKKLRECAENVKENCPVTALTIPENKHRLKPGLYTGEELGAMIYFIADMIE